MRSFVAVVGIVDMQKLVSSATQQVVYSVKCGVLLGRAQSAVLICYEHSLIAELFLLEAGFGLTASADAAAGAGHDLDKVEELFAAFDLFDELVGIAEAACNGYLQSEVTGLDLESFMEQ